ncbi:MAG TPA: NAD(P)-dependent oxidoreductase, partial [Falsiroseomonas sp.]|nr:NAD(P)-dependent oxidoreductase [Falsiroseomonas sp.]
MTDTVLITGASGRLGSALAVALSADGFALRLTDLRPFPTALPPGAVFEAADLADAAALARLAQGCRAILHFGGIPNDTPPPEAIAAANLTGVRHVYEAARLAKTRIVFASSNHAMGYHPRPTQPDQRLDAAAPYRPDGLYGLSKVYGEQSRRTAPFVAAAAQRRRQLLLHQLLDQPADSAPDAGFDRIEPTLTGKQGRPCRPFNAILFHGVVSARRANAGIRVLNSPETTPLRFPTTSATAPPRRPSQQPATQAGHLINGLLQRPHLRLGPRSCRRCLQRLSPRNLAR